MHNLSYFTVIVMFSPILLSQTQDQNQRAMKIAQANIPFSSNNPPYKKENLSNSETDIIEYKRNVGGQIALRLANQTIKNDDKLDILYRVILEAIIGQATQCGNCGELTAMVFCEFVETSIQQPVEIIHAYFVPFRFYATEGHAFVLKNRNENTPLNDLSQWTNTTFLDAWMRDCPLNFSNQEAPNWEHILWFDLSRLISKSISSIIRRTESLNHAECNHIVRFLKRALNVLNETGKGSENNPSIPEIIKNNKDFFERKKLDTQIIDTIFNNFKRILTEKIALYSKKAELTKDLNDSSPNIDTDNENMIEQTNVENVSNFNEFLEEDNSDNDTESNSIINSNNDSTTNACPVNSLNDTPEQTTLTTENTLEEELVNYNDKRITEYYKTWNQYNSIWAKVFTKMSYDVKTSAVEKMLALLRNEENVDQFTDEELDALRNARLGDIISQTKYVAQLPAEFINQEQARALRKFNLCG